MYLQRTLSHSKPHLQWVHVLIHSSEDFPPPTPAPPTAEPNLLCRHDAVPVGSLLPAHLPSDPPPTPHPWRGSQDNWDLSPSVCIWPCRGEIRVGFIYLWETVREIGLREERNAAMLQIIRCAICFQSVGTGCCGKRLLNKLHSQHELKIPLYLSLT